MKKQDWKANNKRLTLKKRIKYVFKNFYKITKKKHAEQFFVSGSKKYKYYFKKRRLFKFNEEFSKQNKSLSFGYFVGLRSKSYCFLTCNSLISCLKFFKRFGNVKYKIFCLKYRLKIFPDFWLTAKPREVRMGKGKGPISKKIYFVKKGSVIFEFNYSKDSHLRIGFLLKKCSMKLPFKNSIIYKFW